MADKLPGRKMTKYKDTALGIELEIRYRADREEWFTEYQGERISADGEQDLRAKIKLAVEKGNEIEWQQVIVLRAVVNPRAYGGALGFYLETKQIGKPSLPGARLKERGFEGQGGMIECRDWHNSDGEFSPPCSKKNSYGGGMVYFLPYSLELYSGLVLAANQIKEVEVSFANALSFEAGLKLISQPGFNLFNVASLNTENTDG